MRLLDLFRRRETRSQGGFTAQLIGARQAYIAGVSGVGELTSTVQACVSLWEGALALAAIEGAPIVSRQDMAVAARSLALFGNAVFLIDGDQLIPAVDYELSTRRGRPNAYRVSLPDAGGNTSETVLAEEVLHFRVAPDPGQPWTGQAPLRRASLSAGLLQQVEGVLAEVYQNAPIGSQVIPFPESQDVDLAEIGRGFRARRGQVMLRESVNVTAAGGPAPSADWRPQQTTPDLRGIEPQAMLAAARGAIMSVFGVLPALLANDAQGPLVREAQRHLAQWMLQPLAGTMAEEMSAKLGGEVMIDVMRPLQAFDSGNRARSAATVIEALAVAKQAGLSPGDVNAALTLVNWGEGDGTA